MDFFRVLSRKNLAMFPAYTIFAQQNIAGNGNTYAMLL